MKKIGLIAGNGKLPIVIAKEAKASGCEVHICAIKGEAAIDLEKIADSIEWIKLGQLGKLIQYFKSKEICDAVMAGKITKTNIMKGDVVPDLEMIKMMASVKDRKDDTLLGAIADYLGGRNIRLLSSVGFLEKALPKAGVLSKRKPNKSDEEEIDFAWDLAKQIAGLDIGQTVVTKNKAVLAIEAIEGTDQAILRGGELGGGGVVVAKVAKPNQDMRFDVPTIGLQTLDVMLRAKVDILAMEAGKTILLERDEFLKKANQHHMLVVAR